MPIHKDPLWVAQKTKFSNQHFWGFCNSFNHAIIIIIIIVLVLVQFYSRVHYTVYSNSRCFIIHLTCVLIFKTTFIQNKIQENNSTYIIVYTISPHRILSIINQLVISLDCLQTQLFKYALILLLFFFKTSLWYQRYNHHTIFIAF